MLTNDMIQDAANGTDKIIALFELLSNENVCWKLSMTKQPASAPLS